MKKLISLSLSLCLFFVPSFCASCDMAESFGLPELEKKLPREAEELIGKVDIMNTDAESFLEKLWQNALGKLSDIVGEVLRPVVSILVVVVLCSAADSIRGKKNGFDYVNLTACLAISSLCIGDVSSLLSLGKSTMEELSTFSKALLPTLTTAAAVTGAISSATAMYAAALLFLDLLISAANALVFPLVCAYMALSVAASALGDSRLLGAVKLLKWACKFVMTALVSAFTVYMSLTGLISSSTDAFATKAAKTVISAALPVVGNIVSDAAGSIVAGAGVIKGAVGVFGLIVVMAVCLTPFLRIGVRYLLFKAAAALAQGIASDRVSRLIDAVGTACGMILSIVGVEVIFIYISVISIVKAVTT